MVKKSAFTLIELIFAIIIVSIAVLSLPVANKIMNKGVESSLVQEAIFAAATELNEATTLHWDENSIDPVAPNSYARVIDIAGMCDNNTSSPYYRLMPGHINEPLHRRCLESNTTTAANNNTNANVEAIEDRKHGYRLIFLNPTPDKSGYKQKYTSKVTIQKNAKFGGSKDMNIKRIKVTIRDKNRHVLASLKTYVTNIGETDYYKRAY